VPTINRTLLLKRVVQAPSQRFPQLPAITLHTWMAAVFDAGATVWDRHYPRRDKIKPGQRCIFFRRVQRNGSAVLFHAYSYIAGHTPDQVVFDDIVEQVSADPIVTQDGAHKEIVERFAVIVIGEVMILESARVSGSSQLAIRAMRDLIKRHAVPMCPALDLEDAPTLSFRQMAHIHRGVESVTARLQSGFATEPNTFGSKMENIVADKGFHGVKVSTTIEAPTNGELDVTHVEEIFDESENGTGLSGITVRFKDGTSIGDLRSYREKLPITVQQVRPGVPSVPDIETEIVQYLNTLATPNNDNFQLITNNGTFT
jgi:hypothetical protein